MVKAERLSPTSERADDYPSQVKQSWLQAPSIILNRIRMPPKKKHLNNRSDSNGATRSNYYFSMVHNPTGNTDLNHNFSMPNIHHMILGGSTTWEAGHCREPLEGLAKRSKLSKTTWQFPQRGGGGATLDPQIP